MSTTTSPVPRHRTTLALGLLGLVATAVLGTAAPTQAQSHHGRDDGPGHHRAGHRLETHLAPSGDPDGSGEAHLNLIRGRGRVCARITWEHIAQPDAAHIHRRSDGAIVVDLTGAVTGGPRCATGVGHRLIGRVLAHPRKYYLNVHNSTYPAGAIQGTLHR